MSRVGKKPIPIPEKIKINFQDGILKVQGEKGTLSRSIHPDVALEINADVINVKPVKDNRNGRAMQGLFRSLVDNMVVGVSKGFERTLEINGIGYRAEAKDKSILFTLGYSHPIDFSLPDGISVTVEKNNVVRLAGIDNELLGQTAAAIRRLRSPEPYKGKGIKYAEERIQRKAGKTGTSGT